MTGFRSFRSWGTPVKECIRGLYDGFFPSRFLNRTLLKVTNEISSVCRMVMPTGLPSFSSALGAGQRTPRKTSRGSHLTQAIRTSSLPGGSFAGNAGSILRIR